MECKHERIQSVNCVISCMDCGKVLDASVLMKKGGNQAGESTWTDKHTAAEAGAEKAEETEKTETEAGKADETEKPSAGEKKAGKSAKK